MMKNAQGWEYWRHGWFGYIIPHGEVIPRGYGLAWRCWERDAAVVYPVPLNIVLGWTRRAYLWLRFEAVPKQLDRRIHEAYQRGYNEGRKGFLSR